MNLPRGSFPCGYYPSVGLSGNLSAGECSAAQDLLSLTTYCPDKDPCSCRCNGFYVTCGEADAAGRTHVTDLYLHDSSISSLPASLGQFTELQTLNAFSSSLRGTIPASIGNLANLSYLDLSTSGFTGQIPSEIGRLTNLTSANFRNTQLNGTLPASLAALTNLQELDLSGNALTGDITALWPFLVKIPAMLMNNVFDCPLPPNASACGLVEGHCKTVLYSCDTTTGTCAKDPHGTQSPGQCIAGCKCTTPHNCGTHNGTIACNQPITGCNVCDMCCKPWLTVQASCDGCFEAPVPNGCGGKL